MARSRLSRRQILSGAVSLAALAPVLAACQPAPAAVPTQAPQVVERVVTQVVEVEKVVTQVVAEQVEITRIVEQQVIVTATPAAAAPAVAETTTIRFMQGFQPGENEYPLFEWVANEYHARQQAVQVTMMDIPRTDMLTVFQTMSARGEPPDVLIGGPIDSAQARSGVLRTLEGYFDEPIGYGRAPETPWRQVFNQALIEMQKVDGLDYGVPAEGAYTFVFYYNKDTFTANDVVPPTTWTELIQVADVFKNAGVAPFTLAGVWSYYMQWWFFTLAQRIAGAETFQAAMFKDQAASWNQPEFLKAAEELQVLRDGGYFVDGFPGMDHVASHLEFLNGRAAMDYVGTWFPGEMGGQIPAEFNLGSFAFPAYEGGKGDPTFAQLWANNLYVTSTQHIPPAMDFLKWWSSSDVQDKQAELLGTLSARSDGACPPVQQGGCDQVANAQGVAGYEFDIFTFDRKLENRYADAAVQFFFGQTDAAGYISLLEEGKVAYFKSIEE